MSLKLIRLKSYCWEDCEIFLLKLKRSSFVSNNIPTDIRISLWLVLVTQSSKELGMIILPVSLLFKATKIILNELKLEHWSLGYSSCRRPS